MQMTTTLNLALHNVTAAAENASKTARTLEALGTLLKGASEGPASLDIESLARLLLTLGLCLVHRDVVMQTLEIVKQTNDVDGLSGEQLQEIEKRLQLAKDGRAE